MIPPVGTPTYGPYEVHAVCECGKWHRMHEHFTSMFFAPELCAGCGRQGGWARRIRRARYVRRRRWWPFPTLEGWEERPPTPRPPRPAPPPPPPPR